MTPRYAIYYMPSSSTALWRFGTGLLGYDAATGEDLPCPADLGIDPADWTEMTAEPRRYGFHATLKAPFGLREGVAEDDLLAAAERFCRSRAPVRIEALAVTLLGAFVALVPAAADAPIGDLAADCVQCFEPFRAPLSADDRARRLRAPLSGRQIENLEAWGYPYVFEEFRFHMTLTGSLPAERRLPVCDMLAGRYAALPPGAALDAVTVARQADRGARFRILDQFRLRG